MPAERSSAGWGRLGLALALQVLLLLALLLFPDAGFFVPTSHPEGSSSADGAPGGRSP